MASVLRPLLELPNPKPHGDDAFVHTGIRHLFQGAMPGPSCVSRYAAPRFSVTAAIPMHGPGIARTDGRDVLKFILKIYG
jgi:hypothetical protein